MTGRGLVGRRQARLMLFGAIVLDAFVGFVIVGQPPSMIGPMFAPPPSALIIPAVGILMNIAGLAWMVRILRADPEGGPPAWRALRDR